MSKEKIEAIALIVAGILVFIFPVLTTIIIGGYFIIKGILLFANKSSDDLIGQLEGKISDLEGKVSGHFHKPDDGSQNQG